MATQTGSIDLRGVKQSYEGVEVGGRNLYVILNSQEGYLINDDTLGPMNVTNKEHTSEFISVSEGETIIFQNWVTPISGSYLWMAYQLYDSERARVGYRNAKTKNADTGVIYDYYIITIPAGIAYIRVSARFFDDGLIKLEKGTKATTWTPAPEDVQDGIDTAQAVANDASASAISAGESAAAATELANEANTNAHNAETVANLATDIANEAKDNVSNIEQIVGSASWMTSHGRYDKSVDTEKDPSKDYYTITATAIAEPTGSPHNGFYYELVNGAYILSGDTAVVSGKTYYTLEATLVENPLDDPSANDYYEFNLHESVEDYISSHISMNSEGLFVSDGSVSKVQISSTGVSIWNDNARIASYGSVARIGREDGFNIQIGGEDNEIGFYFGTDKMAYINGNELYVQNSLSFGSSPYKTFSFYQRSNGHFTLDIV